MDTENLELTLTNNLPTDVEMDITLALHGLIALDRQQTVASLELRSGESRTVSIAAKELALQTNRGAVHVVAEAALLWDGPGGDVADSWAVSEPIWVQHLQGNRRLRVLTNSQVREHVRDLVVAPNAKSAVLGWAANDKGQLVPFKGDDPALNIVEGGKVVGWQSRESYAPRPILLEDEDLLPGAVGGYETENGGFAPLPAGTFESDVVSEDPAVKTAIATTAYVPIILPPIGKFCMKWKTKLSDSKPATGDDIMNDGYQYGLLVQTPRPAKNATAFVWRMSGSYQVMEWWGNLDADGCTEDMQLQSNTDYSIGVYAIMNGTDSHGQYRAVVFKPFDLLGGYAWYPAANSPDERAAAHQETISLTTGDLGWNSYTVFNGTSTIIPTWDVRTNEAAVMGEIVSRISEFKLTSDSRTFFVDTYPVGAPGTDVEWDRCNTERPGYSTSGTDAGGQYYTGACMGNGAAWWKNILAHEFGHAQARKPGWASMAGQDTDSDNESATTGDTNLARNCRHPSAWTNSVDNVDGHHLNSRELIGLAQSEGWASFIAAMVFNRRDDVDANNRPQMRFGYYNPVRLDDGDTDYNDAAQETTPAPYAVDLISDHQWMKNQCAPGAKDRGNEKDWMSFYYTLYADKRDGTTLRFTITDFTNVMSNSAATGRRWDQVKNAAFASLSPEKYSRFTSKGLSKRVNYSSACASTGCP